MQREEQKAEAKEEAKQAPADVIKEDKRLVNSEYNRVASPERAKRDSKQKGPQRGLKQRLALWSATERTTTTSQSSRMVRTS